MDPSKNSLHGISRFSRSALFVVAPVIAIACGTYSSQRDPDPSPVTLRIGLPVQTGTDPLYGANQAARLASLEGLTTQNINARAVPRLAEGWNQSSNGLAWTIRLRPTAVFHDGTPVDSRAVKNSLERFLRTREGRLSPGLQHIASIDSTGPFEVTIHLRERSNLLLEDLDGKGALVGTGPYVVSSVSGNEVEMTAFPKYYRGIGAVRRIVWRVYPTVRTAWAAALRGEVDFLYEVGPESREFVASEGSVTLYPFLRNYVYALVFNAERPVFKNPEIRRALNYAIDRNAVIERAFRSHGITASGPTWPLHWAYDSNAATYPYDPERAIASIGKIVRTQSSRHPAQGLQFTCLIPENFQLWERLALIVQRHLAEIGVEMQLQSVPFEEFNERVLVRRDFDAVLTEMVSGFSVSRPFAFWHSAGLHSFSGYRNPSVDAALKTINQATNDTDYRHGFQQLQQAMFDDPPAIFLGWGENSRAVSRRFEVVKAPGGDIRMTISDWRLSGESVRVAD
jgi:peptide/nickel transport system substrate-binding protein